MTIPDLLWKIVTTFPAWSLFLAAASFISIQILAWWLKRNIVTKMDLSVAMLAFAESVRDHYVTQREAELMFQAKPTNGKARGYDRS